jgi:hypothetical protein
VPEEVPSESGKKLSYAISVNKDATTAAVRPSVSPSNILEVDFDVLKIEYKGKGDHQVNPGCKGGKFLEGGSGGCPQQIEHRGKGDHQVNPG